MTESNAKSTGSTGSTLSIGCGSGFWGDSSLGSAQLVKSGAIDVLVLDYLAEITMSILARMKQKKPELGYATDFVDAVMLPLAKEIKERKIKVVANAGGVNPLGCKEALEHGLAKLGISLNIAVVTGDDVLAEVPRLRERGVKDNESGRALPEAPVSANAYLGAFPIAEALRRGADVVITGRCVDSAVALGPLIAHFGWKASDYDLLAQGSLVGHVVECGAQATGGVFTDWRTVEEGWSDMGFPIAECAADGSFVVTKPAGTGGLVSPRTVGEQIVYEVHDPGRYILADVVCDFTQVHLEQVGTDRVKVTGAKGLAPTGDYKVSVTYPDGFRCTGSLMMAGYEAGPKANRVGHAILQRVSRVLAERGIEPFRETSVEVIGTERYFGADADRSPAREVVLVLGASHASDKPLELLSKEIAPAGTAMAQSITGFAGGRPRVQPIVRLASCFVPKSSVAIQVHVSGDAITVATEVPANASVASEGGSAFVSSKSASGADGNNVTAAKDRTETVALRELAHGRSGDKGNTANIGILAREPRFLPWIRDALTPQAVQTYFSTLAHGEVRRFEWPGLSALNFVLGDALGGGGVGSLRYDPQGKALAQILLEIPVPVPAGWRS